MRVSKARRGRDFLPERRWTRCENRPERDRFIGRQPAQETSFDVPKCLPESGRSGYRWPQTVNGHVVGANLISIADVNGDGNYLFSNLSQYREEIQG